MPVPARTSRHHAPPDVVQSDRRWFLMLAAGFVASAAGLLALHAVYRATGPHPNVTRFLRSVKTTLRRLVPRFRRH
jgi:hypothetical protein